MEATAEGRSPDSENPVESLQDMANLLEQKKQQLLAAAASTVTSSPSTPTKSHQNSRDNDSQQDRNVTDDHKAGGSSYQELTVERDSLVEELLSDGRSLEGSSNTSLPVTDVTLTKKGM